jgi:hypothetical protein
MRTLYFSGFETGLSKRLQFMITGAVPGNSIERYDKVERLSKRLNARIGGRTLALLLATDEEHLMALYSIKHRLCKVPFVLVLPDREKDTLALGYRLKPHALCYTDSPENEILSAFRQIVEMPKRPNRFIETALNYWRAPSVLSPDPLMIPRAAA